MSCVWQRLTPKGVGLPWLSSLLGDYLQQELDAKDRIVLENESFVALVPYWAVWIDKKNIGKNIMYLFLIGQVTVFNVALWLNFS